MRKMSVVGVLVVLEFLQMMFGWFCVVSLTTLLLLLLLLLLIH